MAPSRKSASISGGRTGTRRNGSAPRFSAGHRPRRSGDRHAATGSHAWRARAGSPRAMGGLPAREGRRPDAPRRLGDGARRDARRPLRAGDVQPAPGKRPSVGRPSRGHPRPRRSRPAPAAPRSIVQEARWVRDARQARGGPRAIGGSQAEGEQGPMTDFGAFPQLAMDFEGAGDGRERALAILLLSMADDEFVIGFSDSEWTGIGPLLEEDVAISSLAQDELGHAQALYRLLAETVADGRDADAWAYDRPPEGYFHARLLDHPRGDWAATIARRYLYDTADTARLEALAESSHRPLAELVAKIRREERYHVMHVGTWLERLADAGGEPRRRLTSALESLASDAGT